MKERYPRLEVNLDHLKHNVAKIVEKCGGYGIQHADFAAIQNMVVCKRRNCDVVRSCKRNIRKK